MNPFKGKDQSLSIFGYVMLGINILAGLALLCADLASHIRPGQAWPLAFLGLAFPFILFVNLFFFLYWLAQRRLLMLLSLGLMLLSYKQVLGTVQFHFFRSTTVKPESIKLMSFNVRLFDIYEWTENKDTRKRIYQLLKAEAPAILCFQEFYSSDAHKFNNLDSLASFLSDSMHVYRYHLEKTESKNQDDLIGAATFSTYPMLSRGKMIFDPQSKNICMWTDLLIGSDTVRVFNIHLQSIRFGGEDYKFIENLTQDKEQEEIKGSMKILRRLKRAFIKRGIQADYVAEQIAKSPYPVILCGDFNDSPSSYTYHRIAEGLQDAFQESAWGFSKTYIGAFPSFRIDYMMHGDAFTSSCYHTIREKLSDHYPISCELEFSKKK